jgi:B12 binding domain
MTTLMQPSAFFRKISYPCGACSSGRWCVAKLVTPSGSLMAAACLRQDRWLVHHLAADLPAADVIGLALDVGADLVVLSAATAQTARAARRAAREIGLSAPRLRVLAGRPGDTLSQLLKLARPGP